MKQPEEFEGYLIDRARLPRHVGIIMDGNGRWAKKRGNMRLFGHQSALKAVRACTELASELELGYLTLYTFSSENWKRPRLEVEGLMQLLIKTIRKETPELHQNNVRLNTIGEVERLPKKAQRELAEARELTAGNTGLVLTLALSYGSRADIVASIQRIAQEVASGKLAPQAIDAEVVKQHLSTANMPDPELIIRTSGEFRISNFMLWEAAYAEFFICQKLWPDFRREDFLQALSEYQRRERRFGKTSEQLPATNEEATPSSKASSST